MATISPGDLVMVTVHNRPITIGWANRQYKLEPGKAKVVPVEAAVLWFGDPRSTDTTQALRSEAGDVAIVPDREAEVRRLCVKYGYQTGDMHEFLSNSDSVPQVTVKTIGDDEEELPTVLGDPTGEEVVQSSTTVAEQDRLRQLIDAQSKQIEYLSRQINAQQNVSTDVPEDESVGSPPSQLESSQPPTRSNTGPEIPQDFPDEDKSPFEF